jgi:hypothetical protein
MITDGANPTGDVKEMEEDPQEMLMEKLDELLTAHRSLTAALLEVASKLRPEITVEAPRINLPAQKSVKWNHTVTFPDGRTVLMTSEPTSA